MLVLVDASYIPPRYHIVDAKADIRDLDVGDVDDVEVDVPKPFIDHMKEVKEQRSRPKIDFNSEAFRADPTSFASGGSGVNMAFVSMDLKWAEEHGKHGTTDLARRWTSLLENGGIKAQIYDTDPGSILIVNQNPMNQYKIKQFVLEQPDVDYYELSQKRDYPNGRTSPLVPDDVRRQRTAEMPGRLGKREEPVRKPAQGRTVAKTGKGSKSS
ncbi:unnamed protein product [Effrenium voratum]|uniref:Uncharacterized protein n=1 Tax=Effrenium voratum TaxID=2562239 RepID=A0AA36JCB8_9DINO|nr:unnamed protein product [Effrenium voratum]CAJ1402436.1 unnamed protein product [Effrenium voratum]